LTTPDPLVGCIFNWVLWVAAGFLLVPLANSESHKSPSLPFLTLWLLYPESFGWNGMTSKETLVTFAVACAVRACSSRARIWTQTLIVAGLTGLMFWVREVAVPLIALALAISLEFRRAFARRTWSRVTWLALAMVLGLYVAGQTPTDEGDLENPLAVAGYSALEHSGTQNLSASSLLRQMGSSDRLLDSFWVPVRGISHLFCPLYLNPFLIQDIATQLEWWSAAICCAAALAIFLRLHSGQDWTRSRAVLFGVLVLGLLTLGLSGILHPRYRSLIVAALLPLGMRSLREELAERGPRRLIMYGTLAPAFIMLLYQILRQFS
jgi:hypothetical protein